MRMTRILLLSCLVLVPLTGGAEILAKINYESKPDD